MLARRPQLHEHFLLNHVAIVINRVNQAHPVGAMADYRIRHVEVGKVTHQFPTIAVEPPNFEILPVGHRKRVTSRQFPVASMRLLGF